ncbi:binary toxin-like calcium binding domain-containing protein, partial [Bacillus wiedmannii]|uniref:binary toxin-like calcium binding domain-containing protein n=1 Tax=Bacillus wiedmannii TaxID=1890302 RepID=UPI001883F17B
MTVGKLRIRFGGTQYRFTQKFNLNGKCYAIKHGSTLEIDRLPVGEHKIEFETFKDSQSRYIPHVFPNLIRNLIQIKRGETTDILFTVNPIPLSDDSSTDTDQDGISDSLETNGYIIQNGVPTAAPKDSSGNLLHPTETYFSNPISASTSGDPYSDYMKTTGVGMDLTVPFPAVDMPFIAAVPAISVQLTDVTVTPNGTLSDSKGTRESTAWKDIYSYANAEAEALSVTGKFSFNFGVPDSSSGPINNDPQPIVPPSPQPSQISTSPFPRRRRCNSVGHGLESPSAPTGILKPADLSIGSTSTYTHTETVTQEASGVFTDEVNSLVATNPSQAATLAVTLQIINRGNASMSSIKPTFNLKLANTAIATIQMGDELSGYILNPNHYTGTSVTVSNDQNGNPIYLSIDQLKQLESGMPLTLETINVDGYIYQYINNTWIEGARWAPYINQINATCAQVLFLNPSREMQLYYVATNTPFYTPNTTLGEAIAMTVGLTVDDNGVSIGGYPMNRPGWQFLFSDQETLNNLQSGATITDVILKAGQTYVVQMPSDQPQPEIIWSQFSDDYLFVKAGVAAGDFPVKTVTANVNIGGTQQDVTLEYDVEKGYYINTTPFMSAVDSTKPATLTVTDYADPVNTINGPISLAGTKKGLKYVPLSSPGFLIPDEVSHNVRYNQYSYSLLDNGYPDAKAVYLLAQSNSWSSNQGFIGINGFNLSTGMNDRRFHDYIFSVFNDA